VDEQRRNEIIYRWHRGQSMREIARGLRISRRAVHRALAANRVCREGQSAQTLRHARRSKLDEFDELLRNMLARYPHMTVVRLLDQLQRQGFRGGYTIVRERVKQLRPPGEDDLAAAAVPGAAAEAGYHGVDVEFTTEGRRRVYLFEYRLLYSGRQYLRFAAKTDFVTTIALHLSSFDQMEGVAPTCFYGTMKAIALRGSKNESEFTRGFLTFASYYGFKPICRGRQCDLAAERRKRLDEVAISLLRQRTFRSLDELNDSLSTWLDEVADVQIQSRANKSAAELHRDEVPFLIPLPDRGWSGE
jgi:transposase